MAENAIFYWQQNSHLSTKSDMERLLKHGQPRQGDILSAVHFHECLAPELFKFLGEESMPRLSQKVEAAMAANDHDINHAHGHDLGKALATLGDYLSQCAALVKQSSGDQYYTAQELADRALKSIVDPGIQSNLAI